MTRNCFHAEPSGAVPARFAVALLALLFAMPPALAGTIDVAVVEKGGRPIVDQIVLVHPPLLPGQSVWTIDFAKLLRGLTGRDGHAIFKGVPEGRYAASLGPIFDSNLIDPGENPNAPPPIFTVAGGDDSVVAVTIEVWRGVNLSAYVNVDRGEIPPNSRLVLRSLDGPGKVAALMPDSGRIDRTLVPGRWEAGLEIPAGYLLVGLEHNGESLPGATARIDVLNETRDQHVTWSLSARALVTGTARSVTDSKCVRVTATLVTPGPWLPEAMARGGSEFRRVPAQSISDDCVYKLWLPDGTWRLAVEGADVLESIPEFVEVSLSAGDTRAQNFAAKTREGEDGTSLWVMVESPDGTSLPGAVVEVWPAVRGKDQKPVRTAKTEGAWRPAKIKDLADGDYKIVAGHAEYLESTTELLDFGSKSDQPKFITLKLKEGARIRARATNESGAIIAEVGLDIVRIGDPPRTELADEDVAARKRAVHLVTDATGRAESPALPPGAYRTSAKVRGEQAGTQFVQVVASNGRLVPELEIELDDAERVDLELKVVPAPSVTGTIACTDGGAVPARTSFRVFSAADPLPDPWQVRDLTKGAALALDGVRFTGDRLDRFRVGPLPPGAYVLAVRPQGHEYWNWFPGLLTTDRASVIQLQGTSTNDLGATTLECSPLVLLSPRVGTGEPVPDFRDAILEVGARRGGDAHQAEKIPFELEKEESRAFLVGLPQAKLELSIAATHPYLVPATLTVPRQELDLLRGKLAEIALPFEAVGGLVEVRGAGTAARLNAPNGEPIIRPLVAGRASFPGTRAGAYRVDVCADSACREVIRSWERVDVAAARTVTVGEAP